MAKARAKTSAMSCSTDVTKESPRVNLSDSVTESIKVCLKLLVKDSTNTDVQRPLRGHRLESAVIS